MRRKTWRLIFYRWGRWSSTSNRAWWSASQRQVPAVPPTSASPQPEVVAAILREILPPYLLDVIDVSFIRSHHLYDEFVCRLVLKIIREMGLESAIRAPGGAEAIAARERLDVGQAVVPLDWMLRLLASRGMLEEVSGAPQQFRARDPLPTAD